ncbi:MAG: M48 family metallopeptidase [Betaproteobacteria bacterium]|nr:M48 family metallopeptidase [Betaproteobacteria bacterium]
MRRALGILALWLSLGGHAHAFNLGTLLQSMSSPAGANPTAQGGSAQPQGYAGAAFQFVGALVHSVRGVPLKQEDAIGRQIAGNLLGAAPLVPDPRLQRYVNLVGRWVAAQSPRPSLRWRFGVIDSSDINAFSAPGGYVFITEGLYRLLDNESELAGVLGHEIGHVVKKHELHLIDQQKMIAAVGEAAQVRSQGQALGNQVAQNLIGSGAQIMGHRLDKDDEYEADRIGVVLAARAGYDPYGLPAVLQKLEAVSRTNPSAVALLFYTHPSPESRLAHLAAAMGGRFDVDVPWTTPRRFYRLQP